MPQYMRRLGTQFNGPFDAEAYDRNPQEYALFDTLEDLLATYEHLNVKQEREEMVASYNLTNNLAMNGDDKLQSIRNAVAILPPNLFVMYKGNKQPKLADVEAIVGFKVSSAMLQEAMSYDEVPDESKAA